MLKEKLTVIAGAPGAGKTAWIAQQIQQFQSGDRQRPGHRPLYCALGGAGIPLDAVFLGAQSLDLDWLPQADFSKLAMAVKAGRAVFLELHSTLDLGSLDLQGQLLAHLGEELADLVLERVAFVPEGWKCRDLEAWSDRLFPSPIAFPGPPPSQSAQLWSLDLTGQVFDPPSLDLLWQELTGGAYGQVQRAKGIFCLADGSGFFFSFVPGPDGHPGHRSYSQLPFKPFTEGRPDYPSGLEVLGHDLAAELIFETIQNCLLSDGLLQQFQASQRQAQEDEALEVERLEAAETESAALTEPLEIASLAQPG